MPFRDRLRRLRKSSLKGSISADNSPPSVGTPEAGLSTGEQTPAMTKTPTTQSHTDLTTIGEVLTQRATLKAEAEGKSKKKGFFRRKPDPYKDWPTDVYKPHEVPAPKYRRAPDPKHIENLSNFSFGGTAGDFMRRLSMQSGVSPGQSRAASRMGSIAPASQLASVNGSRNPSFANDEDASKNDSGIGSPPKDHGLRPGLANRHSTMQHHEPAIQEGDENETMSRQRTIDSDKENKLDTAKTHSRSSNDMPFTQQQLTQALNRASIQGS